jgi:hypothetical protein
MRKLTANLINLLHWLIVIVAIGLFLVPESLLPGKIAFHFYYLWGILAVQILSGSIMYPKFKKFYFLCPISPAETMLRGTYDERRIGESFTGEIVKKYLKLPPIYATYIMALAHIVVTIQFFNFL